ncbi:MAG: glycoside hydrolase family 44 protein [Planctomycetota bacterium]
MKSSVLCGGVFGSSLAATMALAQPNVTFSINPDADLKAISSLIYGINGAMRPDGLTGLRSGGNRLTGYNWETNHSNAGHDWFHHSDNYLVGGQPNPNPAAAVMPMLNEAAGFGGSAIVTVPMAGYVSADANGTVGPGQTAPSSRWLEVRAKKSSVYNNSPLSLTPNKNDGYVFTDEFVNYIESNRPAGLQNVMYSLDNEPSLWDNTHPRIFGETNPTFEQVTSKSIEHASAIKDVAPNAKVLGGVLFGYSAQTSLHGASDIDTWVSDEERNANPRGLYFNRHLLREMHAEEERQGRTLMDVLDIHWYPEARGDDTRVTQNVNTPGVAAARVQAARSLWDADFVETSWITQYATGGAGINLLPRIQADIDELKPGTLISISEYNFGGANHISGGIAQADVLGVFGREGVYNANRWPLENSSEQDFAVAGFEAFTNFDGEGGQFGDLSVQALTDDNETSAIYASRSTENPDELILVAINRTGESLETLIQIAGEQGYSFAEVFQLTGDSAEIQAAGVISLEGLSEFTYEMPAFSVSTIRLTAVPEPNTVGLLLLSSQLFLLRRR